MAYYKRGEEQINTYEVKKIPSKSGKRLLWKGFINGRGVGSTLWARKYDAEASIRRMIENHGHSKLNEMSKG